MDRLPKIAMQPDWHEDALCFSEEALAYAGITADHFHPSLETGAKFEWLEEQAKAVCNSPCPIKDECLDYALNIGETLAQGVFGGTTEKERRAMRRRSA
jgi:WhiB family redox-sensing transcriptional regulator